MASSELAERLVQFDRQLAYDVLGLIVERLGGPRSDGDEPDLAASRDYLANVSTGPRLAQISDVSEPPQATAHWKTEFRQDNRLRELGLELTELLGGPRAVS
ncbi:MAG: hypothetical protein M3R70_12950 [Actinomycetota bacterium]|nr:hypothetical protein [Actinomycetota bacterium]